MEEDPLVGPIYRHIQLWVLVDIAERQTSLNDQLLRLEAYDIS
jgi:hypothetical protein